MSHILWFYQLLGMKAGRVHRLAHPEVSIIPRGYLLLVNLHFLCLKELLWQVKIVEGA